MNFLQTIFNGYKTMTKIIDFIKNNAILIAAVVTGYYFIFLKKK